MFSKGKLNKIIIASIILNIVLFGILCFGAYYKRVSIANYITKFYNKIFFEKNIEKTGEYFNEFSHQKYKAEIQYINNSNNNSKIKIAILGNSLTLINDWNGGAGLTASEPSKDYVHILLNKISDKKFLNIEYLVLNIAEFEREFDDFDITQLEMVKDFKSNIIIFQIGENVINEKLRIKGELFVNNYIELIKYFNVENVIICLPFWPDIEKINLITEVAIKSDSYLVDLSRLGSGIDPLNFARSEKKYDNPGVGAHPGDYGMNNIAKLLYITINKIL